MKKFKVFYRDGKKLGMGDDWFQTISAETAEQAYRKFIQEVGVFAEVVYVDNVGFPVELSKFNNHVEEAKKGIEEQKAETSEHTQESADKENSNHDQPNIDAKTQEMKNYYDVKEKPPKSNWGFLFEISGCLSAVVTLGVGWAGWNGNPPNDGEAFMNFVFCFAATINFFFVAFLINVITDIRAYCRDSVNLNHKLELQVKELLEETKKTT